MSEFSSRDYWQSRYAEGKHSGAGSYGQLALFKANVINSLLAELSVSSLIDWGVGDGNQLQLLNVPRYVGIDVSETVVDRLRVKHAGNTSMEFWLDSDWPREEKCDLSLSSDVIYHLVEDAVFEEYMSRLFASAERYVLVYASNFEDGTVSSSRATHVRHRKFTDFVAQRYGLNWELVREIPNLFPYRDGLRQTSLADFFLYARTSRIGES